MDTNLSSKIELFLSCRDLPDLDTFSKSDPFCVVSLQGASSSHFHQIGQTSTIQDNHHPSWPEQFKLEYHFEENQRLRFDVYDRDDPSQDLSKQQLLGSCTCALGDIVAAPGQTQQHRLRNGKGGFPHNKKSKKVSSITIRAEEVAECHDVMLMRIKGIKLAKKDFWGKSDPYVEFHRSREDNSFALVHKTEVIMNNLNPTWRSFEIPVQRLCNGDLDRPLLLRCFDWDSDGSSDLIGECQVSVRDIAEGQNFTLRKFKNRGTKKANKSYGELSFQGAQLQKRSSFLDYIKGGCQISLQVAIDFTASNGDPNDPRSLHSQISPNQYERVIRSVGNVLQPYDSDQKFPVWGFGAKLPNNEVSHCFALTFDESNPEVHGIDGIVNVYKQALSKVRLSGPTLFSQIIDTSNVIASAPYTPGHQHYTILLILTDGVINDAVRTVRSIVTASDKPLSIVIIGVGDANFGQMEVLDGDDGLLRDSAGKQAQRDIVQFVPFNQFKSGHVSALAQETLKEIPGQFLSFMSKRGIQPLGAREFHEEQFRANTMQLGPQPTIQPTTTMSDIQPTIYEQNLTQQMSNATVSGASAPPPPPAFANNNGIAPPPSY